MEERDEGRGQEEMRVAPWEQWVKIKEVASFWEEWIKFMVQESGLKKRLKEFDRHLKKESTKLCEHNHAC